MSAYLLSHAMKADVPSRVAKLVLIKIVDVCDDEGRNIWPSLPTLARAGCCSEQQVRRVLALFCEVGLLRRVRRGGQGRQSAKYEMDTAFLRRLAEQGWPRDARRSFRAKAKDAALDACDGEDEAEGMQKAKGDMVSPLHGVTLTPEPCQGDTSVTQSLKENPYKEERERGGADAGPGAGEPAQPGGEDGPPDGTPSLDDFRKAWPTTPADDAGRVASAWAELPFDQRRAAVEAVPGFLDFLKQLGRKHPPAGFNYLRDRRWLSLPDDRRRAEERTRMVELRPFSREWWAAFLQRIATGRNARFMLSLACDGKALAVPLAEAPGQAELARFKGYPADGEAAKRWRGWLAARGYRLPDFAAGTWLQLPGEWPPGMAQDEMGGPI
ncbi:pyocin large subunit [Microcystis phage vB_MweS-yong2]|nr:pyocin large subunit [Microcystis phage vB_MweS-yong2]